MQWIHERFLSLGNKPAIVQDGRTYSYAELAEAITSAKKALGKEKFIPITNEHAFESIAQLLAVSDTNQIALPIASNITKERREEIDKALNCDVLNHADLFNKLERSGLVLFSSGTSGDPKGMLHNLPNLLNRFERIKPREDRTLQLLLMDHIGGIDASLRCLLSGSTLIIPDTLTPDAVGQSIQKHRVNVLPASPTFLNLMFISGIHKKYDCRSLEVIAYGAEPMPQNLLHRLAKAFPKAALQQKFGTSETGAVRIQSEANESLFFRIQDPDTQWQIIDKELWLKTPSRIIGYINSEQDSLEADGWYRTGDLVEESESGAIRIVGRKSDLINVGGQKVHPSEIESIINELPNLDSCRVFAEPHPITGQQIACEIFSTNEQDPREWKRTLRQHCRGRLEAWKIPSQITISSTPAMNERLKIARTSAT